MAGYNRFVERPESESFLLLEKIKEQVALTCHLVSLIPVSALEWRPAVLTPSAINPPSRDPDRAANATSEMLRVGDLLGHLLDCTAGFCALLYSINKGRLSYFEMLRGLPVNHFCGIEEASARLAEYLAHIEEGFACLEDSDLCKLIPTVFVPDGEPVLTLLLGNLEHLINHKYQLFIYLRLLGVKVATKDLYRIRGSGPAGE